MKYVKIILFVTWIISLADLLGVGAGVSKSKKSYAPLGKNYFKSVGALNVLVGVVATVVLQLFVAGAWTGPQWLFTLALVGGWVNIFAGVIMVAIGVMMYPF